MAALNEKGGDASVSPNDHGHSPPPYPSDQEAATLELPKSWKYRQLSIGSYKFPYYASPQVQLVIVAFVCFLCPGMFNALSGLGGAGNLDPKPADDANMALYATFSVIGFFAGTFTNKIGIKLALAFGGTGTYNTPMGYPSMPLANITFRICYLRCILPFLRTQPQLWICRFRWNIFGHLCWNSVVRPGSYHDELSTREI